MYVEGAFAARCSWRRVFSAEKNVAENKQIKGETDIFKKDKLFLVALPKRLFRRNEALAKLP